MISKLARKYLWIGVGFLLVILFVSMARKQILPEDAIALEHDGTDSFLEQVKLSSGAWVENAGNPVFDNEKLAVKPRRIVAGDSAVVLGSHIAADGSEKWIEVDLSDFRLNAWEGNRKVFEFSISSGRPGYKTVTGEFRVWRKVRNQAYRGGSKERGDYYYLPNVPYSLFFHGGYAIHGAYWHDDFGIKNRSSGCVNLRIPDAEQLYNWAGPSMPEGLGALSSSSDNPGVRVVVHD
ncbi:MAG: L,D-transpeptidase [Candidatus Chisholmbacteria bacterium]|nr:L,D-transpeptidase [Candidatus Chisholmbacteria bacterium]